MCVNWRHEAITANRSPDALDTFLKIYVPFGHFVKLNSFFCLWPEASDWLDKKSVNSVHNARN